METLLVIGVAIVACVCTGILSFNQGRQRREDELVDMKLDTPLAFQFWLAHREHVVGTRRWMEAMVKDTPEKRPDNTEIAKRAAELVAQLSLQEAALAFAILADKANVLHGPGALRGRDATKKL